MYSDVMRHALFLAVIGCLVMPLTALAQDTPRFGVVMGYPAQVGFLWNISDRTAIRPELSFARSTSETTRMISFPTFPPVPGFPPPISASTIITSSAWQVGIGAS